MSPVLARLPLLRLLLPPSCLHVIRCLQDRWGLTADVSCPHALASPEGFAAIFHGLGLAA